MQVFQIAISRKRRNFASHFFTKTIEAMKRKYERPEMKTFQVATGNLMVTASTNGAEEMSSGSFGSRGGDGRWDDED